MTPRTLFSIVLKLLGILFVKDVLLGIPELLYTLTYFLRLGEEGSFGSLALFVLSVGFYLWIAYCLLFKTEWIITRFNLDAGFEVDAIRFNMHRSTVFSICIIIIGSLMFVQAVPLFIKNLLVFLQQLKTSHSILSLSPPDKSYLVSYGVQIIIGLLLVGNQRHIVNFIESRRTRDINNDIDGETNSDDSGETAESN